MTSNYARDVVALANALSAKPLHGRVLQLDEMRRSVRLDGLQFLQLVLQSDLDPGLAAGLPAAVGSDREGDPAPLLRLEELVNDESHGDSVDAALYAATTCDDGGFPWKPQLPIAARPALLERALSKLPTDSLGGFGRWAARLGDATLCLRARLPAASPLAAAYPDIPALALSGGLDMRTPRAEARAVLVHFPHGHLLAVPNVGHSVLTSELSLCLIEAVHDWLKIEPVPRICRSQD